MTEGELVVQILEMLILNELLWEIPPFIVTLVVFSLMIGFIGIGRSGNALHVFMALLVEIFIWGVGALLLFAHWDIEIPVISPNLCLLIFVGISIIYWQVTEKLVRQRIEIENLINEFNQHSLFNELSRLKFLISKDPQVAKKYLVEFANMFRTSLSRPKDQFLAPLNEQIDYIKSYIAKQTLYHGDKIRFNVHFDQSLENVYVYWNLFFPLVENAVKYTEPLLRNPISQPLEIKIALIYKEQFLEFMVCNPFSPEIEVPSTQTGIRNLERRLEYFYPNKNHTLELSNNQSVWTAKLIVPLLNVKGSKKNHL